MYVCTYVRMYIVHAHTHLYIYIYALNVHTYNYTYIQSWLFYEALLKSRRAVQVQEKNNNIFLHDIAWYYIYTC